MSATDAQPSDGQLESEGDLNEDRAKRCGWLVLGGLVLETALTAIFPAHEPAASNFWLDQIEIWGPVAADALVALGVYGELRFSGNARRIDGILRRRSNKRVEEATNRLADVELVTATLHATAEMAEERAAKAELETMRLKALSAWRSISQEQEHSLRFWLGKFTGGSVIIRWFMYDIESHNLAEDIGAIFRLAGWKARLSPEAYSGNFAYGLRISSPRTLPPELNAQNDLATEAVKKAFEYSFFDFMPLPSPSPHMTTGAHGDDISSPCAEVYVGPKPPPNRN